MTNSELLRKAIKDAGIKNSAIMNAIGIKSYATLRAKIDNKSEFTAREIQELCELLNIDQDKREAIFFATESELYSA